MHSRKWKYPSPPHERHQPLAAPHTLFCPGFQVETFVSGGMVPLPQRPDAEHPYLKSFLSLCILVLMWQGCFTEWENLNRYQSSRHLTTLRQKCSHTLVQILGCVRTRRWFLDSVCHGVSCTALCSLTQPRCPLQSAPGLGRCLGLGCVCLGSLGGDEDQFCNKSSSVGVDAHCQLLNT